MNYTLQSERGVGEGILGAIERVYRCDNRYGLIVVTEPPGSPQAGRMTVTPVFFEGEGEGSYLVLSKSRELQEGLDGELLEPRRLESEEELSRLLERLCALEPEPETLGL